MSQRLVQGRDRGGGWVPYSLSTSWARVRLGPAASSGGHPLREGLVRVPACPCPPTPLSSSRLTPSPTRNLSSRTELGSAALMHSHMSSVPLLPWLDLASGSAVHKFIWSQRRNWPLTPWLSIPPHPPPPVCVHPREPLRAFSLPCGCHLFIRASKSFEHSHKIKSHPGPSLAPP